MQYRIWSVCLWIMLVPMGLFAQGPGDSLPTASGNAFPAGVPVVFEGTALFSLYDRVGAAGPEERAQSLVLRLEELLRQEPGVVRDSFSVAPDELGYAIMFKGRVLAVVTADDAAPLGQPAAELAEDYTGIIFNAVEGEVLLSQPRELAKRIVFFVLGLVALGGFWWLLRRFFRWLQVKVEGLSKNFLFKASANNKLFTFITPRRERHFWAFFFRILKAFSIILTLVLALPYLFRLLPWTQNFADWLIAHIKMPLRFVWKGLLDFLPDLVFIVVIVVITRYVIRFFAYLARELEHEKIKFNGFYGDWAKPTFKMVRFLIIAFALIIVFPYLPGSDSPAFQGVSIFLGVLFSLGSTSAISNMVAGVVITYMRPFTVGDRVRIGETTGDVMERTLLVTRIKTIKNVDITIPNSAILGNHLVNFSKNAKELGIILNTSVTIGYDVPSKVVIGALIKAAQKTPRIEVNPEPFVLQTSLEDFYVAYELNAVTREAHKMAVIYSDLHSNMKDELHAAGVEILSPHYSAVRDGNVLTVPPENIPAGYEKPGFSIESPLHTIIRNIKGEQ